MLGMTGEGMVLVLVTVWVAVFAIEVVAVLLLESGASTQT
jgi:hypothetical protein